MMRGRLTIMAVVGALTFSAAAVAQDVKIDLDALGLESTTSLVPPSSDVDWHQRFSLNIGGEIGSLSWNDRVESDRADIVEIPTGAKWGFTLGIPTRTESDLELDAMSAGAFFNLTPRMRIGGQVSFTSPQGALVPGDTDRDTPEVKLESAFRF